MNNSANALKDTRLLEALEFIDDSYIADVFACIKAPDVTAAPAGGKGKILRSLKYVAAVAACALIMSTLIPVVQYVSGNLGDLFAGMFGSPSDTSELTAEETNKLETEYPLTKEELDAINEAWAKEKGTDEKFAESIEELKWWKDKICPVEYGNCVFGKYGDVIVLCKHNEQGLVSPIIADSYVFMFDHRVEMWVCKDGNYYTVSEAYEMEYLTERQVKELADLQTKHNNTYRLDDDSAVARSYAKFTPELETLTAEEMLEIDRAYAQCKYDYWFNYSLGTQKNEYIEIFYADIEGQKAYRNAKNKIFSDPYKYRYYGKINGFAVIAVENDYPAVKKHVLAGYEMNFPEAAALYIYKDDTLQLLRNAYFKGVLTDDDIGEIAKRHKKYNEFLQIDDKPSAPTVEKTEPSYVKFADVEPLTKEEMLDIRDVWANYWYNRMLREKIELNKMNNEGYDVALLEQMALESCEGYYEKYREALFYDHDHYRYYGKFGDCIVIAREDMLATSFEYNFGGEKYWANTPGVFVCRGNEVLEIDEAYQNGWLTLGDISNIFNVRADRYRNEIR